MLCGRTSRVAPSPASRPYERWDGRDPERSEGSGSLAALIDAAKRR